MPTGSGKEEQHKTNEIVKILNKIQYSVDDCLSCVSFHANKKHSLALEKVTIALFLDSGPSVSMIKHIMITSQKGNSIPWLWTSASCCNGSTIVCFS